MVYSDTIEEESVDTLDKLKRMLVLGEKYLFPLLKEACQDLIIKEGHISTNTACMLLAFAKQNNATKVKQAAIKMIEEKFAIISKQDDFINLMKHDPAAFRD